MEDPKIGAAEAERAEGCKIWYAMVDLPGVPDKELHVRYSIDFELDALEELKLLRKGEQAEILKAVRMHLSFEPTRQSKSRIKHLRPGTRPPYRLRVDDFCVYYDVQTEEQRVIVYGVVHKERSLEWLAAFAEKIVREEESNEDDHSQ